MGDSEWLWVIFVHFVIDGDVCMCVIRVCVKTRSHMCTLYDGWGCVHVCYTGVCEDSESYVYITWWMRMCACVLYGCVWGLGVICVHCMMGDSRCVHVCYTGVCEDSESYVYIAWWMRMCACVLYGCVWGLGVICVHWMMDEDVCMCVIRVCVRTRSHMCTLYDGRWCVHVC